MARPIQRSEQRSPQRPQQRTAINRYDVDMDRIPPGMTYGWKRKSMAGKEDVEHLVNLDANGWTPVPAERHPELSGRRLNAGQEIDRGGLVLMEQPTEWAEDARELDHVAAQTQVAHQMKRLGLQGHRAAGKGIKRTYEPPPDAMMVGDDE